MPTDPTALITSLLVAALSGCLGVIGTLLVKGKDRDRGDDERRDMRHDRFAERSEDRGISHAIDLSSLHANVAILMADRGKLEALISSLAKVDAWQTMMQPRIEEAHEGLRAVVRLEERITTLFRSVDDVKRLLEQAAATAAKGGRAAA